MSKKDYVTGYKKPPKEHQFKKGQSGNSKGRPKMRSISFERLSQEALHACFIEVANTPVVIQEKGVEYEVPFIMALVKNIAKDAARGDRHAQKLFLNGLNESTKTSDQLFLNIHEALMVKREERIAMLNKIGTVEFYQYKYNHFITKTNLRATVDKGLVYEADEPKNERDWAVFLKDLETKKNSPEVDLPWPPNYPSKDGFKPDKA